MVVVVVGILQLGAVYRSTQLGVIGYGVVVVVVVVLGNLYGPQKLQSAAPLFARRRVKCLHTHGHNVSSGASKQL